MKEIDKETLDLLLKNNINIEGLSNKRIKKIIGKVKRKQKWRE